MQPTSNDVPSTRPYDLVARAQKYIFLVIDADEARSQKVAGLLTLAGLRAVVAPTTYQAFERFLQERFTPCMILLGQQEERSTPLFARFFQRLTQELQRETPVHALINFPLLNGNLLMADAATSPTTHRISKTHAEFLKMLWQILPAAQFPLQIAEHTLALETLPKLGMHPRVAQRKRSSSTHFHNQLKAAKKVIPASQWEILLPDVGLAQFRKEESWPPPNDQLTTPPEYLAYLNRAVMLSNPEQPLQQAYTWASQVNSDVLQKVALIFIMQQAPKVIGPDLTMRALLNVFTKEIDAVRGEKLTDWRRLDDGSFICVFYSNMFTYGFMGANQSSCATWQDSFDLMLDMVKQQKHWLIREVECSGQTHTGHCIFQLTPR